MYEATSLLCQPAMLSQERIPDETTIFNFHRLLERNELVTGILVGVSLC
jgi:IS5 family transposase